MPHCNADWPLWQGIQIMPKKYVMMEGDTVFLIAEDDVPGKAMAHLKSIPESVDDMVEDASPRGACLLFSCALSRVRD